MTIMNTIETADTTDIHRGQHKLEKKSLKQEIADLLHTRVVAGEYQPGTWLRQEDIAQELDVSPTPVREAFDALVAEGLAEKIPYRGVRVPQFSKKEIADAYQLRFLLEVKVTRLAAQHVRPEQADAMEELLRRTKPLLKPEDMPTYRRFNRKIHQAIAAASDNPMLNRSYNIALNHFPDWMLYENLNHKPEELEASLKREYREHAALIKAVVDQDFDLAVERAKNHLNNIRKEIVSTLDVPEPLMKEREQALGPL